ncbi:MAG TPA: hypothetical protein VMH61_06295 [Candidatus Acidoferrales bacterium]|nr:hypothetical protein [Candidatus Acidoferrales bacterium]
MSISTVRAGRVAAAGAIVTAVLLSGACARALKTTLQQDQRPIVTLSQYPANASSNSSYAYELSWIGADPDGRVVAYRYVVDPPAKAGSDTAWIATQDNRKTFVFRADSAVAPDAQTYHTFVVEAIDDQGLTSLPAYVSFTSRTIAPTVRITSPVPSALLERKVAPSVRIRWTGNDPDGLGSRLPVRYAYKLFNATTTPTNSDLLGDPSLINTLFAPNFTGWSTTPGTIDSVDLHDLGAQQSYVFVVVAIDTAGAYTPTFTLDTNMLQFGVNASVSNVGPRITVFNSNFTYQFPQSGLLTSPGSAYTADFSSLLPIQIQWSATPSPGSFLTGFRWAVDIASIDDNTPRSNESADIAHWSQWSSTTAATLPAWQPPAGAHTVQHTFYLEAEDDLGLLSLVMVNVVVVQPSFERSILLVDDTWMTPDYRLTNSCADPPGRYWPSAAELDTFLVAAGGVPWRCYPGNVNSTPGLFAGYDVDTLGSHFQTLSSVSLQLLDRYKVVMWMTDGSSALSGSTPFNTLSSPMPLIRALVQPGISNPLLLYSQQGGRLWISGGGFAYASLRDYKAAHQVALNNIFSNSAGELVAGRFMYDFPHWQSELTLGTSTGFTRSPRAVGGWAGAPDYTQLPAALLAKTTATDPVPPQRTASTFYATTCTTEFLSKPNTILEPRDGVPGDSAATMLDTLYQTNGGPAGIGKPAMTLYHGHANGMVIYSGFPIWYFQRAQAIALVDWVLQNACGMTRRPVPR